MISIALAKGMGFATVDDVDAEVALAHSWRARVRPGERLYVITTIDGRPMGKNRRFPMPMHRLVGARAGFPAGAIVDHINGDTLNNTRSNLRPVTAAQNSYNQSPKRTNPTRFKGITAGHTAGTFIAQGGKQGMSRYLGTFHSAEEAARAYDEWAREAFGDYARLNFPKETP